MITITIIGSGKVAYHLICNILESDKCTIKQIYARNPNALPSLAPLNKVVNDISALEPADVFIIAVSDDAIQSVSEQINVPNQFTVHTSGTKDMQSIVNTTRKGVLYPLQSFSKQKEVDFSLIPFCLETSQTQDFELLEKLACSFSQRVYKISSEQRKSIHLSAVFVNNFTNHLYTIAQEICQVNQVPFEILKPLILETAQKVQTLDPILAQTGPAARNDLQVIANHLELLQQKDQKQIYQLITNSILKHHV